MDGRRGKALEKAMTSKQGEVSLEEMKTGIEEGNIDVEELIPNVQIFKEIMVELLKSREIEIRKLKEERREYISEFSGGFRLNEMILSLVEDAGWNAIRQIRKIEIYRMEDGKVITFENVEDGTGNRKNICCSNVLIRVRQEG